MTASAPSPRSTPASSTRSHGHARRDHHVIKSEGGKYKVTAPVAYAADEPAAKAAFEALEKLDFGDLVTEQEGQAGRVRGRRRQGPARRRQVREGGRQGPGRSLRGEGRRERHHGAPRRQGRGLAGDRHLRYTFDKGPADWRDKSITTFTAADAERLEVTAKDGAKITLKKTGAKGGAARTSGTSSRQSPRSTSSTTRRRTASCRRSRP